MTAVESTTFDAGLPTAWKREPLGALGRWLSGGTPNMAEKSYWGGAIPWVSPKDMKLHRLHGAVDHVTEQAIGNGAQLAPAGALLMVVRGMILAHTFPVARAERTLAFNQDIKALVVRPDVSSEFLLYWLKANEATVLAATTESSHGTKRLATESLRELSVALPPLPEQRAIAAALSDVDDLIASLDRLIAKKRDLKQAAMQQLLTGKTRLPGFWGDWEVKRFGELTAIRNEKAFPQDVAPDTVCVELEHIGQGNGRLISSSTAKTTTSLKYRFCREDVLFGRLRPYLRKYWLADRDGLCTTEIWPLVPKSNAVTSAFLFALVQTSSFIETACLSYGTHMPRADWQVVRTLEAAIPTLKEQTAIAEVLSDMDAEIAALEARREKTKLIKQGMMQELLTGRTRLV